MEYRDRPTPARILGISSSLIWIVLQTLIAMPATAQMRIPLQPFAQQVRQIETTLAYLGEPLPQKDQNAINEAIANADETAAIVGLERVLDKYTLAIVEINPESRVKVRPGPAKLELVEAGTRIFLVKVANKAGVTARLETESPNAQPVYVQSDMSPDPPKKIAFADVRDLWMGLELYDKDPMSERLSGLPLEQHDHFIAKADVLRSLANVEADLGGALPLVAAVDFEDSVLKKRSGARRFEGFGPDTWYYSG
jgi:hypothetical protein